jgi:hypothetical protein
MQSANQQPQPLSSSSFPLPSTTTTTQLLSDSLCHRTRQASRSLNLLSPPSKLREPRAAGQQQPKRGTCSRPYTTKAGGLVVRLMQMQQDERGRGN